MKVDHSKMLIELFKKTLNKTIYTMKTNTKAIIWKKRISSFKNSILLLHQHQAILKMRALLIWKIQIALQ